MSFVIRRSPCDPRGPRGLLALLIVTALLSLSRASVQAEPPPPATGQTVYAFDIPAGPLDEAIVAFRARTGRTVEPPDGVPLAVLMSPGVRASCTADEALERLLAGTPLRFRTAGDGRYALDVAIAAEQVDVTARLVPYRGDESATATRTPTPVRDVPQTLIVVPHQLMTDQNVQSVGEAMRNVPGVSVAQGEGNRDQVVIRGISSSSDFYVNGIRDDQERFRDLYNVNSVEVLQGPAAVLFGRGGGGGVVNLVTRGPVRGAPSEVELELGSFDHKRATAQIDGSLGARASFHVSAMGEDSDSFRDSYFLHRYAVNPTLRVEFSGATTLTAGVEHLNDRRLADRGIPSSAGGPVDVSSSQLFGSPTQNNAESGVDSVYVTFAHRFANGAQVRNSFLAGQYDKYYQNVYPGSAVNAAGRFTLSAYNHTVDRTNVFNQSDLIYAVRTGPLAHTLLAGVEVGHQFQDEVRHTAAPIPNVEVTASVHDANFATAPLVIDRHAASDVVGIYVQDQIAMTGQVKAVVGARTDRFSVAVDDHMPGASDLSRVDVATSPRVGIVYQPNDRASIYTSYTYTFLPSGQTLGLAVNTVQLEPENAKNYEAGAKFDLFDRRLAVTAAFFRLDRNNVKNTDPNDPGRLVLTGQQRTNGVVVSVAGNIGARLQLQGGYSNLDARITADTASAPAGRKVGLVPRSQFSLWSTYLLSKRWTAGGGLVDQSSVYTSFTNQVELPRLTRVDAMLAYRLTRARIAINAENLTDTVYYPTANGDNNISPGSPRAVRVSLSTWF